MDRDSYFTPREAAEYGVVDQVITHADELQGGAAQAFV
jgi:ATP-dependent protease ClpP protease subunit